MEKNKNTGFKDLPILDATEDKLESKKYVKSLARFIEKSDTPFTIAIQGEWGSGKTSIMNMLKNELSQDEGNKKKYETIWLNTWQYTINNDSRIVLKEIIIDMLNEITKTVDENSKF